MIGLVLVAVLAFALVVGAGSAAAVGGIQNATCTPQLESLNSLTEGFDNVACSYRALYSDTT